MIPIYINGVKLLYFNELSLDVKIRACNEIIADELKHIETLKRDYFEHLCLHDRINDVYKYKNIIRRLELIKRMSVDTEYLYNHIENNLCMFYPNGEYYRFYK